MEQDNHTPTGVEPTTTKKRSTPATWDKLKDAPSHNLPFPTTGNITAVELITFLPSSLKSWDIIERFVSNGATVPVLAYILNSNRQMPHGQMAHNSMLRIMQFQARMRPEQRYQGWTVRKHVPPADWNEGTVGLSVGGYRTQYDTNPRNGKGRNFKAAPMPFKDLANGVKTMPTGTDALDLTRCIKYHLNHPREKWLYPDQFEQLVTHLGGPATVTADHLDSHAFALWGQRRLSTPATEASVSEDSDDADDEVDMPDAEETMIAKDDTPVETKKARDSKATSAQKARYDKDEAVKEDFRNAMRHAKELESENASDTYEGPDEDVIEDFRNAMLRVGSKRTKDMDSEEEELYNSWVNWKKHGIRGLLSMPAIKKRKSL